MYVYAWMDIHVIIDHMANMQPSSLYNPIYNTRDKFQALALELFLHTYMDRAGNLRVERRAGGKEGFQRGNEYGRGSGCCREHTHLRVAVQCIELVCACV